MRKGLLGALEGLEEEVVEPAIEEVDFAASMLDSMECSRDLDDINGELHEACDEFDNSEAAVERLAYMADAIEQYGICRPMMEAADPGRELVTAGICCAYEDLSDVPMHNSMSEATVECIRTVIEASTESVIIKFDELDLSIEEMMAGPVVDSADGIEGSAEAVAQITDGKQKGDDKPGLKERMKATADAAKEKMKNVGEKVKGAKDKVKDAYAKRDEEFEVHGIKTGVTNKRVAGIAAAGVVMYAALFYTAFKFMMFIGRTLFNLGKKIVLACQSYETSLKAAETRLTAIHGLDDAKFKATSFRAFKKEAFKKALGESDRIMKMINSGAFVKLAQTMVSHIDSGGITAEHVSAFTSKADALAKEMESMRFEGKPEKGTGASLGWSVSEVNPTIKETLAHIARAKATAEHTENTSKEMIALAKALQAHAKSHKDMDESQKEALKGAVKQLRLCANHEGAVAGLHSVAIRSIAESTLGIARAAMKCGGFKG